MIANHLGGGLSMQRLVFPALAIAVLFIPTPRAHAFGMDGNKLLNYCGTKAIQDAPANYSVGLCQGYVEAGMDYLKEMDLSCPGPHVSNGQVGDVVIQYLVAHPESRDQSGKVLVFSALAEAFPCPKKAKKP
jgi:hypothetical protein